MTRALKFLVPVLIAALAAIVVAGCRTTGPMLASPKAQDAKIAEARALFDRGQYNKAMLACIDVGHANPEHPGLDELQRDISQALWEQRAMAARLRQETTDIAMHADLNARKLLPATYGLRRGVQGETAPLRTEPTDMERALQKLVTVHLDGVNLSGFIMAIGADENINIIADQVEEDRTMSIHAENVPLREILDYVSRNMGVVFSVGRNMIWVTPKESQGPRIPMETRMYRLRKGLSSTELQGGVDSIGILEAIERFVPTEEGADMFFNDKAHVLIVRNTRDNLFRIEELIEALDISPPQVLIEARFVSSGITDLRELGVDWVLNSAVSVTKQNVLRNGSVVSANSTEIASGGSVEFTPFARDATGLNLTYSGVLTDPMFEAVIHALETSGRSRTLSVPKVTTVNNRPATIRVGEDFYYFDQYTSEEILSETSDDGRAIYVSRQVPTGTPQQEELGIQLSVTPSVGADLRSITLYMTPEIKDFVRWEYWSVSGNDNSGNSNDNDDNTATNDTGLSTIKLPIFRVSSIETEVIVQSGETVVMGGLITSSETDDEERIPILSSIPILGNLFKYKNKTVEEKNLLIFVTATILSERGEDLIPILPEDMPAAMGVLE